MVRRTRAKQGRTLGRPDVLLAILVGILVVFGILMVFEASIYNADQVFGDRFYFVKQQIVWVILGSIVAGVVYAWDYRAFAKLSFPAMIVTIALLLLVLIFGTEINGSRRWFYIGGIPLQPAELAKPVFILYLSSWLAKDRKGFSSLREALRYHFVHELLTFLVLLGVVGGLVLFEPDLGTTLIICVVAFAVYFSSGRDMVHTLGSALIGVVGLGLGLIAVALESYRLERVRTFMELLVSGTIVDPTGSGYQIQQVLIGIGSGGFWGKGFGESRQRFGYLVENTAFTDSIFAIILEEMGMIGGLILISLFVFLLIRAFRIAVNAPDKLGQLLAGGIGFWLVFQGFLHMAANVALIPVTGVPLTFLSYGGSSMVVALMGVGILLNVSRHSHKQ